jgi:threonine dehydrogenase-like Zn-dependent dehydrogenase
VLAVTFHGVRDVRVETVPDPRLEGPGDAIVRTVRSAVCGSDLHPFHGRETGLDAGTVLGHELVGEVVEVGSDVGSLRPGQLVVSPFTTSCGSCRPCREGLTCRCERGRLFGWVEGGVGLPGTQAELVRVPLAETTLVAVPPDVPADHALLAGDVLSTGLFGVKLAGLGPGRSALVVGCGPVGLAAVVAAIDAGAAPVLAADSVRERLAQAAALGAVPLPVDEHAAERLREHLSGEGVHGVVEAVGLPAATRLGFDCVRAGGTIAAVGVHVEERLAITPGEAYDRNLTYRAGRCPARRLLEPALALARRRPAELERLLTHRVPLREGADAYTLFDERRDGCVKVLLLP